MRHESRDSLIVILLDTAHRPNDARPKDSRERGRNVYLSLTFFLWTKHLTFNAKLYHWVILAIISAINSSDLEKRFKHQRQSPRLE